MLLQVFATSAGVGIGFDLLFLVTAWVHVFLAPYTKVEESFNLHATHDVLAYGVSPSALPFYDHFVFPGAVPRTFIGSIVLAAASYLPLRITTALGLIQSKVGVQIIIRLVLATFNAVGLILVRRAVQRRFGTSTSGLFTVLTCTQFHLPFWIGRTLPNMFALLPVNMATSLLVFPGSTSITARRHQRTILCIVGSAAVIFRSELVLLLLSTFVAVLCQHSMSPPFLIPYGASFAIGSIASTVLIDSYFWNRRNPPLWPELSGILFNVYEGKSSEWGTSPYHAYLTHHLPKLLLASLPLAIFACLPLPLASKSDTAGRRLDAATVRAVRGLLAPSVAFVLLISGLGHKEWRFVVYVVPVVNVAAAVGAKRLITLPHKRLRVLGRLVFIGLIACNILVTVILTTISRANYPGGAALALLNAQHLPTPNSNATVSVHIDNLAAQTGASLFTQEHSAPFWTQRQDEERWTYSKDPSPASFRSYTYLVRERPTAPDGDWDVIGSVDALDRVDPRRGWNGLVTKPTLFILRNRNAM
ncbi:dolichyl-P-Man:Man(7)GlcNAc(2)-PP-dolichol alpha-1,6-mannosyltransferase [Ceratobasidium sp. UAMH 11750]|nr:dolichyl-P-Man:Man(7)GlcNAc(2)-PP-dolichol alpha-1,6-mannosyltransferase [Ceratobasidium sp. UAMH 11750]